MTVLAITKAGNEYLYNARTAHKVSKRSAEKICKIVNDCGYRIKDGEAWHCYEVGKYDTAYDYAETQRFTIRNGLVKAWYN